MYKNLVRRKALALQTEFVDRSSSHQIRAVVVADKVVCLKVQIKALILNQDSRLEMHSLQMHSQTRTKIPHKINRNNSNNLPKSLSYRQIIFSDLRHLKGNRNQNFLWVEPLEAKSLRMFMEQIHLQIWRNQLSNHRELILEVSPKPFQAGDSSWIWTHNPSQIYPLQSQSHTTQKTSKMQINSCLSSKKPLQTNYRQILPSILQQWPTIHNNSNLKIKKLFLMFPPSQHSHSRYQQPTKVMIKRTWWIVR